MSGDNNGGDNTNYNNNGVADAAAADYSNYDDVYDVFVIPCPKASVGMVMVSARAFVRPSSLNYCPEPYFKQFNISV